MRLFRPPRFPLSPWCLRVPWAFLMVALSFRFRSMMFRIIWVLMQGIEGSPVRAFTNRKLATSLKCPASLMQDNRSLNGSLTFSSTAYILSVNNALGIGAIVDLKPRAMTFVRCPFDPWSLDDGVWLRIRTR